MIALAMGAWRGFIHETLSLLAWVASFVIARLFAPDVAHWIEQYIESQALILFLSWIIPFLSTLIAFNLLKMLLISLITVVGLRPVDRLLGAVFGALKGALLVTAAVLIIQLVLSRSGEPFKTESRLVPHFQVIALWMLETLDKETELSLDNVVGRLGRIIDSTIETGTENLDIQYLQKKLGLTLSQARNLLNDEEKLSKLKNVINNPKALEAFKNTLRMKNCDNSDCS
ncbi:MAG: membrane protein required for colicin V production [Enterobacterales bacterium]